MSDVAAPIVERVNQTISDALQARRVELEQLIQRQVLEQAVVTQRGRVRYSREPLEIFDDAPPETVLARRSPRQPAPLGVRQLLEDESWKRRELRLRAR